jgi:hypothetical protein
MKESAIIKHLRDFKNEIIHEFRTNNNPAESELECPHRDNREVYIIRNHPVLEETECYISRCFTHWDDKKYAWVTRVKDGAELGCFLKNDLLPVEKVNSGTEQPFNEEYAIINGIRLKRKNETLRYCERFTFEESLELAKSRGLRVPSKDEWAKMLGLGHTWDNGMKGLWIGRFHNSKAETNYSTFLPAAGYFDSRDNSSRDVSLEGCYWSCSDDKILGARFVDFYSSGNMFLTNYSPHSLGFSVRCIVP